MKLLTLNTHSLIEPGYEEKLLQFAQMVCRETPDIIALQEVNQTACAFPVCEEEKTGYVSSDDENVVVRQDNHAARLASLLRKGGQDYFWTWVPAKLGYDRYDEGLALFSKAPIRETDVFFISKSQDYHNWKTRKTLGIRTEAGWFYTVHMGWWKDEEEPFGEQWKVLSERLKKCGETLQKEENVWLMGDFNSQADIRGEGYDLVAGSGWKDTFVCAEEKDEGVTAEGAIDGWKDKDARGGKKQTGMRIDYIWCNKNVPVRRSQVVCNGVNYPKVSDHYGVLIEAGGKKQ